VFGVYSAIVLAVRIFGARLPDRLGSIRAATLATATSGAGLGLMGLWATRAGLFAGTAVFALGVSLAFPALMSLAVDAAPESERASVVGTFTAFFDAAQGVGAVALGAVVARTSYRGAFLAGCAASAAALVVLRLRYRTRATARPSPTGMRLERSPGSADSREFSSRTP
jgi:MFS family permease